MMSEDVRQIKLSNNEEIICLITDANDVSFTVSHCLVFIHSDEGSGFVPWFTHSTVEQSALVNINHVVATMTPNPTVMKFYYEAIQSLAQDEPAMSPKVTDPDTIH